MHAAAVRHFGAPCLTSQEYRAVVYSLHGLPEVTLNDGEVVSDLVLPTQKYVATKMGISQGRVSHLLASASMALLWFEDQGTPGIGWVRLPRGRGAAKWDFRAPVLACPIPKEERPATSEQARRAPQPPPEARFCRRYQPAAAEYIHGKKHR